MIPVDIDLAEHVKLHSIAFSKGFDLGVVSRFLQERTAVRGE